MKRQSVHLFCSKEKEKMKDRGEVGWGGGMGKGGGVGGE